LKTLLKVFVKASICLFLLYSFKLNAQDKRPLLLSGYVVDATTKQPLQGVTVIIPSAGVGVNTSEKGIFNLKVYPGDSIVLQYVGYRKAYYLVPDDKIGNFSIVVPLTEEVETLGAVQVFPYPDENSFKEAFLKLETEDENTRQLRKNLNKEKLAEAAKTSGMDSQGNYENYSKQQTEQIHSQTTVQSVNIFSPTAWRQFLRDLKQDLKKK
jgi:CarboxypepD_reg-like domain